MPYDACTAKSRYSQYRYSLDYLIMLIQVTLEMYRQQYSMTSPISPIINFQNQEHSEHSTNLLI